MKRTLKILTVLIALGVAAALAGGLVLVGAWFYINPDLPDTELLRDVQFQVPLRVYTKDAKLIAEFGEHRRIPIRYDQLPKDMIQAFLAAEDDRFFEHPGVDWHGLVRAGLKLATTGRKSQGGSTITMQVARNFFLSREKSYSRKLTEIFLAFKIEQDLNKGEILALYLNKIYLGQRAYGVAAAAKVYYGVELADLTLAQTAVLAGLPKAPSTSNPITNPKKARGRRSYVLGRMLELGSIDQATYDFAMQAPMTAKLRQARLDAKASFVAEMVRAEMVKRYGTEVYTRGQKVYTTIDSSLQEGARQALRSSLLEYDRRHGYRGADASLAGQSMEQQLMVLESYQEVGGLEPALVLSQEKQSAIVRLRDGSEQTLDWKAMSWARHFIDEYRRGPSPKLASDIFAVGDVIRVEKFAGDKDGDNDEEKWRLAEIPLVEGALVSLDPNSGAIESLVGGFDFAHSKFNRVTQAKRQPGSNIKPFIYAAALAKGFTPATIINDAPVVFDDSSLEASWRPENYSGKFYGPTRLRHALIHSRNLVSIRILDRIGIPYAIDYLTQIGFKREQLPRDLSLALGSATLTPLELVSHYAVLANGGRQVEPWFIQRIEDSYGREEFVADPIEVCVPCEQRAAEQAANKTEQTGASEDGQTPSAEEKFAPRVMTAEDNYLIYSIVQDVIRRGTGRKALKLGRKDIAGKTGTTNDQKDAWFSGFNADVVTTVWVGFDEIRGLGARETGGRAALPAWIKYMEIALKGRPEHPISQPPGIVRQRIDPVTGAAVPPGTPAAIFEQFRVGTVPKQSSSSSPTTGYGSGTGASSNTDATTEEETLF